MGLLRGLAGASPAVGGSTAEVMTESMICSVEPKKTYPRQRKVMIWSWSSVSFVMRGMERMTFERSRTRVTTGTLA